ncbi:MAG TPA: CHRD domain-containing protein [Burkholderiaceae bacterium]|nr:CHRD domain-containing protein [Burkholderiaceae bacterium]
MNPLARKLTPVLFGALAVIVAAGCASRAGMEDSSKMQRIATINLDGSHEVPPVNTTATAMGTITVSADKSVRGSITTTGIDARSAHIHEGAPGVNGPVIIPLEKIADNTWAVPAGAMLTDAQYASYMAGNLYVNVHSAAYPNGEIRAQLNRAIT